MRDWKKKRLSPELQQVLRTHIERCGFETTVRRLGIPRTTVARLASGIIDCRPGNVVLAEGRIEQALLRA